MKIITLLENGKLDSDLVAKHGLSLYIETNGNKILFDTGPKKHFIKNANKLNVSIEDIDYAVISHGHFDHGGGLKYFLELNKKANVYTSKYAFNKFYTKLFFKFYYYVGLKTKLKQNNRVKLVDDTIKLNENIYILTDINKTGFIPKLNEKLHKKENGLYKEDDFNHEIVLVIKEDEKIIMFTGCSHSGITNMIDRVKKLFPNENLIAVIGGMHLYNPVTKKYEPKENIDALGESLKTYKETTFYTCHCTGEKGLNILKDNLDDKIIGLKTGSIIEI